MIASRLNARSVYLLGIACAALWWPGSARGQILRADSSLAVEKEVSSAVVLGLFVPGGGQMYAGRRTLGAALLATTIAAPVLGYLSVALDRRGDAYACTAGLVGSIPGGCGRSPPDEGPLKVGLLIGAGAWLYGLVTAPGDIHAWNKEHAAPRISLLLDRSGGRTLVGAAVRISF